MSHLLRIWLTPVLSVAGVLVAAYLTYVHYEHDALVCGVGDCALVQTSAYATLAGVPIAVLGLVMYVTMLALGIIRAMNLRWQEPITAILFSLSLTGLLYAIYLTYVEIWVIDAICQCRAYCRP